MPLTFEQFLAEDNKSLQSKHKLLQAFDHIAQNSNKLSGEEMDKMISDTEEHYFGVGGLGFYSDYNTPTPQLYLRTYSPYGGHYKDHAIGYFENGKFIIQGWGNGKIQSSNAQKVADFLANRYK